MWRWGLAAALVAGLVGVAPAVDAAPSSCTQRTLVVSAMPIELGPILAQEKVQRTVTTGGHDYFVGRLRGHDVVLSLTNIGPVNATRAAEAALRTFRCGKRPGIDAIVFSGVAGGDYIGDVIVPTTWTLDAGKHFYGVDKRMLGVARKLPRMHVPLESKAPVGDPACGCVLSPDAVDTVAVTHKPKIEVGGAGQTTDPFSGRALPCIPGGGDVFGCEPCVLQSHAEQATTFAAGIAPFVDPSFFTGYFQQTSTETKRYVTEDEETAAVAKVAAAHRVPFLGFRAVSDGGGDPLGLPGFPFQFFYYRQISADNAAMTTLAFLGAWHQR
jgi:nucleoside phosphorylase